MLWQRRFSHDGLAGLSSTWSSRSLTGRVREAAAEAMTPPAAPPEEVQAAVALVGLIEPEPRQRPLWLATLCQHREVSLLS